MATERVQSSGSSTVWARFVGSDGAGLTGLSPSVQVSRASDGQFWDDLGGYQASPPAITMTEHDAANEPGLYRYLFDASLGATEEPHHVALDGGASAINALQEGEVVVGGFVDDLDAPVSSRATQADILSDATPFPGANVDATISSRAIPGDQMALVDGAITALKIASNAITSAKVAASTIGASQIASGAINSSKIAANAIGALQIAADAITSAKIATDAIGASELAADAASEIASAVYGTTEAAAVAAGEMGTLAVRQANELLGRQDVDFNGAGGWQLVIFDRNDVEIARADLFDEAGARIPSTLTPSDFAAAGKMIARVDPV